MFENGNVYIIYCSHISPPHPKISLCVCSVLKYFFFINSNPSRFLPGQIIIHKHECQALEYDSYMDLSSLKTFSPKDLGTAQDRQTLVPSARIRILNALKGGIKTLSEKDMLLAIKNLSDAAQ